MVKKKSRLFSYAFLIAKNAHGTFRNLLLAKRKNKNPNFYTQDKFLNFRPIFVIL
jgi:hypothetical protein